MHILQLQLIGVNRGCPTPIPSASSFPWPQCTHSWAAAGTQRNWVSRTTIKIPGVCISSNWISVRQSVSQNNLVSHIMNLGAFDSAFKEPQVPVLCHHKYWSKYWKLQTEYSWFLMTTFLSSATSSLSTSSKEEDKAELQKYFNQYAHNTYTLYCQNPKR